MGSVCPSDRSDYLKAAEASIYINVEQRGRVREMHVFWMRNRMNGFNWKWV